jgi:hypothetical protein
MSPFAADATIGSMNFVSIEPRISIMNSRSVAAPSSAGRRSSMAATLIPLASLVMPSRLGGS